MSAERHIIVIGAGISGLCTAYWLTKAGFRVTVLERDGEAGGTMKTVRDAGWLIETGPNSALETTPLLQELFVDLGIADERIYANDDASKRYIVRGGTLHPLPMGPGAFLTSRLWTVGGKLRLLREPFIGRGRREESIAEFVTRRLGREFLDYAINPFVAGVYAGSPERLSVQAAFPKLYALEATYGGLMKGALMSRRARKQRKEVAKDRARLFSFTGGMQTFPAALARALEGRVECNAPVASVVPQRAGAYPIYTVSYERNGISASLESDGVVFSSPARATADVIRRIDPAMATTLEAIPYPPVAEIFLGFRREQIPRPVDGFGFLVPQVEQRSILGCIWSSTLFPGRAPDGHVALTTFVGGSRQPDLVLGGDEDLLGIVLNDLRALMGIAGEPVYRKIIRWEHAIPQYELGYHKALSAMERFEQNFRGAVFSSNFRGGIAVGDCVMSARKAADRFKELFPR
jgi:oxygen-dependent protoporphyrinogen oxidase